MSGRPYTPPEGRMSLRQLAKATKGVYNAKALVAMARHGDLRIAGAHKDPAHPKYWVIPTDATSSIVSDAERIISLGLRNRRKWVSVSWAADKLGVATDTLKIRDIGQQEMRGTWLMPIENFRRAKNEGVTAFPISDKRPVAALRVDPKKSGSGPSTGMPGWLTISQVRAKFGAKAAATYHNWATAHRQRRKRWPKGVAKKGRVLLFRESEFQRKQKDKQRFIRVTEAARLLGVAPFTLQKLADNGHIEQLPRKKGHPRRILRDSFMGRLPHLQERLDSMVNITGYKLKRGKPLSDKAISIYRASQRTLAEHQQLAMGATGRIREDWLLGKISNMDALDYFNRTMQNLLIPDNVVTLARRELFKME